jgi:hypothetical protein
MRVCTAVYHGSTFDFTKALLHVAVLHLVIEKVLNLVDSTRILVEPCPISVSVLAIVPVTLIPTLVLHKRAPMCERETEDARLGFGVVS